MERGFTRATRLTGRFVICAILLFFGLDDLHAQFNGLFVRADGQSVTYFDLSQAGGIVVGSLFHTRVDSSRAEGLSRSTTEVSGRAEGGSARLTSTFFLLSEQVGTAQSSAGGFTLRISTDDGTLQELPFRRTTSSQINAAIRRLAAQGDRAHAAWALVRNRRDAINRVAQNRAALSSSTEYIQRIGSRLDSLKIRVKIAESNVRIAQGKARTAQAEAQKERTSARTEDEQDRASDLEYAASTADHDARSAEFDLESASQDVQSLGEDLTNARQSADEQRRQIVADSTWLVTHGVPAPLHSQASAPNRAR